MSPIPTRFDFLPPGIVYVVFNLLKASVFPISVYLLSVFARDVFHIFAPAWLVILATVSIIPLAFVVSVNWTLYKDERDAHALGAVMVPWVPSKRLGGTDILSFIQKTGKTGYLVQGMQEWIENYGHTVSVRTLFGSRIFTDEPEYTKTILSTNFDDYEKGPSLRGYLNSLLGAGVFNSDGDMWKFHRSMTRPFFTHDKISHFDIFDRHADDVIDQLKARLKEGIAVDIQDAACRFTLDCASEFLFGNDVHSLSAGLPYPKTAPFKNDRKNHLSNVFADSFMTAQISTASRSRFGDNWPLFEFWEDKVKKEMKNVHKFIEPMIKDVLEKRQNPKNLDVDEEQDVSLLDHLVKVTDDPLIIRDEIANIMVAGRDTTAALITFAVYVLAEHPRVLERLRQEILDTVGPTGRPSPEDLKDMKYLRAVLNETLRLFPPVPLNTRTTRKPVVLPSLNGGKPLYIPADTRIHFSVFLTQRRKDLWGPDALEFDPDRFLDDRVRKYLTKNPFIFLPFNGGPRICIGQQFAYNEASLMLTRLLQSFKSISIDLDAHPDARPPVEWALGTGRAPIEKIWLKSHLTAYACNGVWVKMEEA